MYAFSIAQTVCWMRPGPGLHASSLPQLTVVFSRQFLSKELYVIEDDDVQQAAFILFNAMGDLELKRCIDLWGTPAGFLIMQSFLLHVLYHLSTYHMEC